MGAFSRLFLLVNGDVETTPEVTYPCKSYAQDACYALLTVENL